MNRSATDEALIERLLAATAAKVVDRLDLLAGLALAGFEDTAAYGGVKSDPVATTRV